MKRCILHGRHGWFKQAEEGDYIVMTGGRIGKDGIHGATFSSEELHEGSPATAVQIGDPITQRKMYDFIMTRAILSLSKTFSAPIPLKDLMASGPVMSLASTSDTRH